MSDESTTPAAPMPEAPAEVYVEPVPTASETPPSPPVEDLVPDPERSEIERLLGGEDKTFTLTTGSTVRIHSLKLREFLRLLKIVTRGGIPAIGALDFDFESSEGFVQSFLALVLFAVPEAEDETVDFLQSMVEPAHLSGNVEADSHARALLIQELDNPELEDMVNLLALIVRTEGRDLQALGKRLRTMFDVAQKMGLAPGQRNA